MRSIEARKYCGGQSQRREAPTCLRAVAQVKRQGVGVALAGEQTEPERLGKEQRDVVLDAGERLRHAVLAARVSSADGQHRT